MSKEYYIGQRSGSLEIIDFIPCHPSVGKGSVVCICHRCGKTVQMILSNFERKKTCGCSGLGPRNKFSIKEINKREYSIWANMKNRCLNTKIKTYADYGARGITICDRWLKFANFHEDMGDCPEGMSIEIIDNDLGYCKENCRWATPTEQAANRRSSVFYEMDGLNLNLSEWARRYGIYVGTVRARMNKGMSLKDALTKKIANANSTKNRA